MPGDNSKQFNSTGSSQEEIQRIKEASEDFSLFLSELKSENEKISFNSLEHSNATDFYIFSPTGSTITVMFTGQKVWVRFPGEMTDAKLPYSDMKSVKDRIERFCR